MEMMRTADPGLKSRFNTESRFAFADLGMDELEVVLRQEVKKDGHEATEEGVMRAMGILRMRKRSDANFSNARAAQLLVKDAVRRHNAA